MTTRADLTEAVVRAARKVAAGDASCLVRGNVILPAEPAEWEALDAALNALDAHDAAHPPLTPDERRDLDAVLNEYAEAFQALADRPAPERAATPACAHCAARLALSVIADHALDPPGDPREALARIAEWASRVVDAPASDCGAPIEGVACRGEDGTPRCLSCGLASGEGMATALPITERASAADEHLTNLEALSDVVEDVLGCHECRLCAHDRDELQSALAVVDQVGPEEDENAAAAMARFNADRPADETISEPEPRFSVDCEPVEAAPERAEPDRHCSNCGGEGKIVERSQCPDCQGTGVRCCDLYNDTGDKHDPACPRCAPERAEPVLSTIARALPLDPEADRIVSEYRAAHPPLAAPLPSPPPVPQFCDANLNAVCPHCGDKMTNTTGCTRWSRAPFEPSPARGAASLAAPLPAAQEWWRVDCDESDGVPGAYWYRAYACTPTGRCLRWLGDWHRKPHDAREDGHASGLPPWEGEP